MPEWQFSLPFSILQLVESLPFYSDNFGLKTEKALPLDGALGTVHQPPSLLNIKPVTVRSSCYTLIRFCLLCYRWRELSVLVSQCWTGIHSTYLLTSLTCTAGCAMWIYWSNRLTISAMHVLMQSCERSVKLCFVSCLKTTLGPLMIFLQKHRWPFYLLLSIPGRLASACFSLMRRDALA